MPATSAAAVASGGASGVPGAAWAREAAEATVGPAGRLAPGLAEELGGGNSSRTVPGLYPGSP
eukprot:15468677-Alexandrium_andersonii.AAC.1